MSGPSHGASPDELDALSKTIAGQVEVVNTMISAVDTPLTSSSWTGPAHDKFVGEWNDVFKPALHKLNESFGVASKNVQTVSDNTRTALGNAGG